VVSGAARILIVDDDPALLEALPEALRLRLDRIEVETCETGMAALERIESRDYDAVVTDIKMPGMDGLELLAAIKDRRPGIPTLLITGHGEGDMAARAREAGAYDYLLKPIDRDQLVESLEGAIRLRRIRRLKERDTAQPQPDVSSGA
jgi:two-component system sensor histidine kinase/response regulator